MRFRQKTSKGSLYAIEGDIKGAEENRDQKILIIILQRQIQYQKTLHLLKIMLPSRIMDQGKIENSVTGVTQGSVLSPILFNISLFEFDKFIEKQILPLTNIIHKQNKRIFTNP